MSAAAGGYAQIGHDFADHRSVVHSKKEFARRDDDLDAVVHSNTAEAFGSMLERALIGVFHQVGKQHIHRYVDEAAFRWNQRKRSEARRVGTECARTCSSRWSQYNEKKNNITTTVNKYHKH